MTLENRADLTEKYKEDHEEKNVYIRNIKGNRN